MNILKRHFLHQITLKIEAVKNVNHMQRLQIHRSYQANNSLALTKTMCTCSVHPNSSHTLQNPQRRWYSASEADTKSTLSSKMFGWLTNTKSVLSGKSVLVYAQGVDSVNYAEFHAKFQMPNTFNTWFLITEIHVWMLMVRAMAEREHGTLIRNNIVESMWSDALQRSKNLGPENQRLIKKQIGVLSGQFQYAIIAYDEGLTTDDKQLASALWKRFFDSTCDNYEHIELMVKYIRQNMSVLDRLTTDEFLTKRNISWPSLKDIETNKQ